MNTLESLVKGMSYQINRRIEGSTPGSNVSSVTLAIRSSQTATTDIVTSSITSTVEDQGFITDTGSVSGIAKYTFNLTSADTNLLLVGKIYYYEIRTVTDNEGIVSVETGSISPNSTFTNSQTADSTAANAAPASASARVKTLIDTYLDTIIHDFRQLRVWDEHARRSSNDRQKLWLTYQNWNKAFTPQVS